MRKLLIYIVLILAPFSMRAQVFPFTSFDYNPATLAKGGAALTETSTVAYATFSNPASIVFYEGTVDTSAGWTLWQPNSVKTSVIHAGGAIKTGKNFGAALGISFGTCQEYTTVDKSGTETGTFKPGNMQFGLGLAYRITPCLSIGANIGYASEKLSKEVSYRAVDTDIYVMLKSGGLKATIGVSEIGNKITSASGTSFSLPSTANLGIGYSLSAGERNIIDINAEAQYYFTDGVAAAAGVSYTYNDMIAIRAGYRHGRTSVIPSFASVGLGFKFFGARLDLTYIFGNNAMANTLAVSLGYSF